MAGKRKDFDIGDLVRKANSTGWIWQVAEFVTPSGHQPHARLVRVNNPSDSRIFAIAALQDRRLFINAGETSSHTRAIAPVQWDAPQHA
jgi:hypothetical protein